MTGDWFIIYNGDVLGYYPASLLKMLNTGACAAAWYSEAARVTLAPATGWAKTEIGSANFADAGFPNAAYVRNPRYLDTNVFGLGVHPTDLWSMGPSNSSCYNWTFVPGTELEEYYLFLGGPGGKNPGCSWP